MTPPTIHLNGTSRESLMDGLKKASHDLATAIQSLRNCAPDMRDYYLQGTEAFSLATSEHLHRVERAKSVKREIDDLMRAIDIIR